MSLFNKKDDNVSTNISLRPVSRTFDIKGHKMTITVKDAQYMLCDDIPVNDMLEQVAKVVRESATKYNPLPSSIVISHTDETSKSSNVVDKPQEKEIIRSFVPHRTLDDVCVDETIKSQILSALIIIKNHDKLYNDWGLSKIFKRNRSIVLNFYGKSGTGKTMMAKAVAGYLGKNVYQVNYAELESKYVGETPKNIVEVFKRAQEDDSVLVFDEADSFLGKRLTNVSQSADYGVNITRSVMLMEIEKYEGVVVFTTNLISNYDEAFKRRIFTSVEFKMPDAESRTQIWKTHIPNELPLSSEVTCRLLGDRYDDISGADIKDMIISAAAKCIQDGDNIISLQHFDASYRYIKNRYEGNGQFVEAKIIKNETITKEQYDEEIKKAGDSIG